MDPETPYPVIDLLPEQKEVEDLGAPCASALRRSSLAEGTRTREAYREPVVNERHRHRYEVNNHFRSGLEEAGLVVSGTYQEGRLVEIIELLPDHPWFVASQFHPEFVAADEAGAALPRVHRRRARPHAGPPRRRRRAGPRTGLDASARQRSARDLDHDEHDD